MSDIKSQFTNVKGKQVEFARITNKLEPRHFLREAHPIQEGIRKDKKIRIHKKFS
ncbi:hypothetical protein SAMN05661008_00152 [Alkalithermobacter thermoalcaliphilus JW-YL-7 = DSM 7308]|uniref:Uncharacterized protein n=1 Tax=Alkalithermobacter thermoalcaliphilus JW-YL-7 = DSM 7308 TaxID=1121328 RepID=A0A150FRQ8_CLOPD|nr:hypothetical protein JWYL7_1369 [[Clostridium] paradoxum JW-YL-7 = DSM 7308]SHK39233.1 hypothetical protein SAMN05661008_00152 [[Clostridium] paradoxum JW-YL-7 = DSM 7308]